MSTGSSSACPCLLASLALACSLTRLSAAHAEEPLLFWQEGDTLTLNQEPWRAGIGWKLSFAEEPHDFNAWELKPKVHRRLQPWLAAAATYKFARGRNAPGAWMNTHVMELDLAPSWQVKDRLTLQFTQRLTIAHPPSGPEELRYRFHAIPWIKWPAAWLPTQTSVESGFEAIYDLRQSCWIETKATPFRLTFSPNRSASWSLFYLLNDKRSDASAPWRRSHVIVLALALDLTAAE